MENKIMIVDDAMFMRKLIRKILEKHGYDNIVEAENGKMCLEYYHKEQPDIVLLDITMPDMSGIEVLEKILDINQQASIIMCSAIGQETMIQQALRKGARDFIIKPFNEKDIMTIIKGCCL